MKKLFKICVVVAFLCSAIYATPGKIATAGLYSNPADDVTSKIGLGNIKFDKVFLAGEYFPEEINFLAATKFGKLFMGAMYQGNFLQMLGKDVVDEKGILGSTTSHGVDSLTQNSNSVLLAFHLPGALPMGFSVGFNISGDYRKGKYNEDFALPDANKTKDHRIGYVDTLRYTPKVGYAIKIPLKDSFSIRPQIDIDFGYSTGSSKTDYIDIETGGGVYHGIDNPSYTPKIVLDVDFGLPNIDSTLTHSANIAYTFNGQFENGEKDELIKNSTRTIKRKEESRTIGNTISLSYTQKKSFTEKVRIGWKVKIDTSITSGYLPGTVTYNTNIRGFQILSQNYTETINGRQTVYGAEDGWQYGTSVLKIDVAPIISLGLQCDINERFKFGAGLEVTPFTYWYTNMKSEAKKYVGNTNKQPDYNVSYKSKEFAKVNIKFSSGLMIYILPNLLLDTSFLFSVPEGFGSVSIANIFSESKINLSLSLKL